MRSYFIILCIASVLGLFACTSSRKIAAAADDLHDKQYIEKGDLISNLLDTSSVNTGFSGIYFYDLWSDTVLYQKQSSHYFVPASNTKILTLYACMHTLGDSIPALRYVETDSTFTFWGTADPTLLHPFFPESDIISFLKSKALQKTMYYSQYHNSQYPYGKGWMWDDYNDYYQAEISDLPMYGNILTISKDTAIVSISPVKVIDKLTTIGDSKRIKRKLDNNEFGFPIILDSLKTYYQEIPYKGTSELNHKLLQEVIGKDIIKIELPIPPFAKTKYSLPVDSVYRRMMQVSDNMLAEHLLLQCGMLIADTLSTKFTIDTIRAKYADIIDTSAVWVDGSGLSRYNLFTPEMIVSVLCELYKNTTEDRLFSLMSVGGSKGSLQKMFDEGSTPYVFAKSGSMAGVYNLSGYMITKSGKKLAFSIMNNNFICSITSAKKVVAQIIEIVRNQY